MTHEALPLTFLGSGLMALGLLPLTIGFFIGLLDPKEKLNIGAMVFGAGLVVLVIGSWLMQTVQ
ncbi:hypothetical protein [Aestuariivirga sp.]|jgi:hypothetical protein|uniref:hypothetical protein n=1 Tax=Aestuariivirga sp. TaxID=2650926 RepID=UPI0037842478